METIQSSTETSEKLGLQIRNILVDGKLTQDMDEAEITALGELFASEETQTYSATKELLKESLIASLKKGISIQGQTQKDFLQKIIDRAGLKFDINAIYDINRDTVLATKGYEHIQDNNVYDINGNIAISNPVGEPSIVGRIEPEERTFIFKYSPDQNGAMLVYEYDDGTGVFNMEEADMLGYIPTRSTAILRESGSDDELRDNNSFGIKGAYTKNGQEKILADTLREDALREQARGAQELVKQAALRAQDAEILLQTQKGDFETQLRGLQNDMNSLKVQLQNLGKVNLEKNDTITFLRTRIENLEKEIGELKKALSLSSTPEQTQKFLPDMEEIKKELTLCKDEISKLQGEVSPLGFGSLDTTSSSELPYTLGKEISDTSNPLETEASSTTPETSIEAFSLHNPVKFWEIGNDHLAKIPMNSQADLVALLTKFEGKSFPKEHFESSEYAYAFQCAISLLDPSNSIGNIDGYWGKNSSSSLKKVQQELLGYSGADADGKPGPKTITRLLEKISQK